MRSYTTQHFGPGIISLALSITFAIAFTGCAAHRPELPDLRAMQTRLVPQDQRSVFEACVASLQDMGYTLETSDSYGGVLTASRVTQNPTEAMPPPPASTGEKKHRMPTWEKVVLVVTGVILVIGAAALIVHDSNDSKKHDEQIAPSDSSRGRQLPQDHETAERRGKHRHERSQPPSVLVAVSGPTPEPRTWHEFLLTIHLQDRGEAGTHVRLSVEDSEFRGDEMIRSGPLDDPDFYDRFFAALERSLGEEPEVQAAAR